MSRAIRSTAAAVLLSALALGCAGGSAPYLLSAPRPIVERHGRDDLVVRWDDAPAATPVLIYAGTSPDNIDRTRPVARMTEKSVTIPDLEPDTRYYFEVSSGDGKSRIVSERLLPLEGADNFRDLGGYETSDGRTVRWGMLYRSDNLADLTKRDLEYLSQLDINLVCDFRSAEERDDKPSRLPQEDPPEVVNLAIRDEKLNTARIVEMIRTRSLAGVDFEKLMIEGNRAFATRFSPQYAAMFERISDPENLPTLVHCNAGKDRTGFAAAIVLLALGVPRETVIEDYMLTNVYTANRIERTLMLIRIYLLFRTKPEAIRPLLSVRREYLEAGFEAIDEEYGSVDAYLREGLGVTDEKRQALRELLLR